MCQKYLSSKVKGNSLYLLLVHFVPDGGLGRARMCCKSVNLLSLSTSRSVTTCWTYRIGRKKQSRLYAGGKSLGFHKIMDADICYLLKPQGFNGGQYCRNTLRGIRIA